MDRKIRGDLSEDDDYDDEEDSYVSDCPEDGYDRNCPDGVKVGGSVYLMIISKTTN